MKLNTINIVTPNPALLSIFQYNQQIITVDTNFFIAPDRSREAINIPSFDYNRFKEIWVHPLFLAFPKIAIHEAVNKEIVSSTARQIVEEKGEILLLEWTSSTKGANRGLDIFCVFPQS